MRQQIKRLFITTTIGFISLGTAGLGGYLVYNYLKKPAVKHLDYDFESEIAIGGLEIKMAPVDKVNNKYFLSNEGKKKFAGAIASELNYGPEFYDVPAIYIDDLNGIGTKENGNYLPSGNQNAFGDQTDIINLNSNSFRDYGLDPVSIDETNDPNQDLKIELLMQILFHEYGHFLANKYIQSEPRAYNQDVFHVFMDTTDNKTRIINVKWNKYFMDNFQKDLNYENLWTSPEGVPYYQAPLLENQTRTSNHYGGTQSLGSIYSANELFQISNHVTKDQDKNDLFKKLNVGGTLYAGGGLKTGLDIQSEDAYNYSPDKLKESSRYLSYMYSSDELFTRKYQQILMPYHSITGENNYGLSILGLIRAGGVNGRVAPFQQDTLNYLDSAIDGRNPFSKNTKTGQIFFNYNDGYDSSGGNNDAGVYMADNPIAAKDELYDIYAQQVGYKDNGHSDDVTVIYYDKNNKLRIGGYISDSYTEFQDDQKTYVPFKVGNSNFSTDVEIYDAHFRMPTDFKSPKLKPYDKDLATKFWVSGPIEQSDASKLIGKPLEYIKEGHSSEKEKIFMKNMKDPNIGLVTSWRSAPGHDHKNQFHLENKDGFIVMMKGTR